MEKSIVISLDREKKQVKIYESAAEAANDVGVTKQAVSYAVRNGSVCAGKLWKKTTRIYMVRIGRRMIVCQKSGGVFYDMGSDERYTEADVTRTVDATELLWKSTL